MIRRTSALGRHSFWEKDNLTGIGVGSIWFFDVEPSPERSLIPRREVRDGSCYPVCATGAASFDILRHHNARNALSSERAA